MDAEQKRFARGHLLQQLAAVQPIDGLIPPTGSDFLQLVLVDAGCPVTRDDVERELRYLEGKGYVELKVFEGRAAKIARGSIGARLLPAGQDLLDGTTKDPAVHVA